MIRAREQKKKNKKRGRYCMNFYDTNLEGSVLYSPRKNTFIYLFEALTKCL